ncbi:MAG: DUF4154 domain-containing protein [Bacteroidetes bacterium]|nr:DUF4154 domain-containing protein [Bacteroidota bacterium]
MRLVFRQIFKVTILFWFVFSTSNSIFAQFSQSSEKMAVNLLTVMNNTIWPKETSKNAIVVGVLDKNDSFLNLLSQKFAGQTIRGKSIKLTRLEEFSNLQNVDVLYVDKSFNRKFSEIQSFYTGKPTLFVTSGLKKSYNWMVDFNGKFSKEEYEINVLAILAAGLNVTDNLQSFAEGNTTWQELYNQSETNFAQSKKDLKTKDQTIRSQKSIISFQNMSLEQQNKLLAEQSETLEKQDGEIKKQKRELIFLEIDVNDKKRILIDLMGEIGRQRLIVILLISILVILGVFAYYVYKNIEKKKSLIASVRKQRDEIERRNIRISAQKEQMEQILSEMTDSLRYAHRIQNALLPSNEHIKSIIPGDCFVYYQPKDIVSGDFYFVEEKNDWSIVAVADCTGHGVPGGFVSMLCIGLLNEIIQKKEDLSANVILNELRKKVISSLRQQGKSGEQMDGMDISLLLINESTLECEFSGANHSLITISKETGVMSELKPDKRPIAIYPDMSGFTNHTFQLQHQDRVYLFTDGYVDQFGGNRDKKFMKKRFKNLLLESQNMTMHEQYKLLDKSMFDWRNSKGSINEQIDDMTILGIELFLKK